MQHINIYEDHPDEGVIVHLPNGESVEVYFDEVDPLVYLVSLDGETRTILIPKG